MTERGPDIQPDVSGIVARCSVAACNQWGGGAGCMLSEEKAPVYCLIWYQRQILDLRYAIENLKENNVRLAGVMVTERHTAEKRIKHLESIINNLRGE